MKRFSNPHSLPFAQWASLLFAGGIFAGSFLAAPSCAQEAAPMTLSAADLQANSKAGALISDPHTSSGRAYDTQGTVHFEMYSYNPLISALKPGWFKVTLTAASGSPAASAANLYLSFWNPAAQPNSFRYKTYFLPQELPADGSYGTVTRTVHIGARNDNYGLALTGGWDGLRIASLKIIPLDSSLILQSIQPIKLLYGTAEAGAARVMIINPSDATQSARLRVAIQSGLTGSALVYNQIVILPPQHGQPTVLTIPFPKQSEYGHALVANLLRGDESLGVAREYFYVSDHPVQIGHLANIDPGSQHYSADDAVPAVQEMRRHYFPMYEIDFWAPDDTIQLTSPPGKDRWWSGQTLARLSTESMKKQVQLGHAQGMKVLGYANLRYDFGFRVAEFLRKYPEQGEWDANNPDLAFGAAETRRQAREDDADRFDPAAPNAPKFNAGGIFGLNTGNPKLIDLHIQQLVGAMQEFGLDGFRYDDRYDYDFTGVDLLGNALPYPGFTNPVILARIRAALEKAKPGAIYGHNMEWRQKLDTGTPPMPITTKAYSGDDYTEFIRDGGLHLQERYTTDMRGSQPAWTEVAEDLSRVGLNAYRWGGAAYNICGISGTRPVDSQYFTALNIAGMSHIAYNVRDEDIGYMRLACRYSDLFYGSGLVSVTNPDHLLRVGCDRPVWWRSYVRYWQVAPGHRIYLVHLINPPVNAKLGEGSADAPEPLRNVTLNWTLPPGWKPTGAYRLAGEGGGGVDTQFVRADAADEAIDLAGLSVVQQPLPISSEAGSFQVTVPNLQIWSVAVLDCTGPTTDAAPAVVQTLPPVPPAWTPQAPVTAKNPPSPNGLSPLFYNSDANWQSVGAANAKTAALRVADADTQTGQAVCAQGPIYLEAYSPGQNIFGGTYRFLFRLKSTMEPPPGAHLDFLAKNPQGKPDSYTVTGSIPLAGLTPDKGWQTFHSDGTLGSGGDNFGVVITGGYPGLLIDYASLQEIKRQSDSQALAAAGGSGWPEGVPLPPHTGKKIWYGEGVYAENYRLSGAVKRLTGVSLDTAAQYVYRDQRGFNGPTWTSPAQLAAYDLVVLGDLDSKTLTLKQRDWLRGYVSAGGSLLMLGGPYGFGRGFWNEGDVASSVLPVTLHSFDLRPDGVGSPLALKASPGGLFSGLHLPEMTTLWLHKTTVKPGASVQMTAGDAPAIVTWKHGAGRVAVVTVAPLGDDDAVPTVWRKSPAWTDVMQTLTQWLLRQ